MLPHVEHLYDQFSCVMWRYRPESTDDSRDMAGRVVGDELVAAALVTRRGGHLAYLPSSLLNPLGLLVQTAMERGAARCRARRTRKVEVK